MTSSLQKGIDAAKSGLMEEALAHFKNAVVEEPDNANVWVWLSAIIDDEVKQTVFLKKALELDPGNQPAQRGLAFIQRKKQHDIREGEKLSDYTHPIGTFKASPISPHEAADNINQAIQEEEAQRIDPNAPDQQATRLVGTELEPLRQAVKKRPGLEIFLYGLTLTVFVVIGILIGTTLLNVDLPMKTQPTPILAQTPPTEGVFFLQEGQYREVEMSLSKPTAEGSLAVEKLSDGQIVFNTAMIILDRLSFINEKNEELPYTLREAENKSYILLPATPLKSGQYCLSYALNPEKAETLYWCLAIK